MGNILGCGSKELKALVAEETTSLELPRELVVEILCNLPVKSLIRFQAVCNPWKLLIESEVFIDMHLHRRNSRLLTCIPNEPRKNFLDYRPIWPRNIVGSCNGIICLKSGPRGKPLILWNPSIREFSFIPDRFKNGKNFAFVYLSKTHDYHIISLSVKRYDKTVDIRILTFGKTISLRKVKDVFLPGGITNSNYATYGATIVWLGLDVFGTKNIVICYDVIEERFSKMSHPPSRLSCLLTSLSVLKDSVIMFIYPESKPTFFDIWMLIDDVSNGKSWRKYLKIGPFGTFRIMNPLIVGWYGRSILCFRNIDNENNSHTLLCYDFETDHIMDHKVTISPEWKLVNYVESLVSIESLGLETSYY